MIKQFLTRFKYKLNKEEKEMYITSMIIYFILLLMSMIIPFLNSKLFIGLNLGLLIGVISTCIKTVNIR